MPEGLRLPLVGGAAAAGEAGEAGAVGAAEVEAAVEAVEGAAVAKGVVVRVEVQVVVGVAAVAVVAAAVVAAVGVKAAAMVAAGVVPVRGEALAVVRDSSSGVSFRPRSYVSGLLSVGRLGIVVPARMSFARVTALARLRGMHSRLLVSGLPMSLPPLPPSVAPPCLPCIEGRQCASPHSSSFPPTEAPLQMLHMDVWGPARVRGQGHEWYFLLVVDDYSRYTTFFPLRHKGEVPDVLIPWISAVRLHLRERFETDLPVLRLHSDRGSEFSSDLLRAFCRAEGIRQTFTLLASPQQNGVTKRRIGLVVEVARTSMIHAAAPHIMWPFAVLYAAHQLNLWPRVSLPKTSPTLRWTGEVGDALVFREFYHPTSRRVLPSQDITFDESVPFYRLFPFRTAPLPPPPLFLAPGPPPVDPLPPQGPAPSGVSQVDLVEPVEVAIDSGAARGAASRGAAPEGAVLGGAEPERAEPGGAEPGGAEPERAEPGGAEPGGAEPARAAPGGPFAGAFRVVLLELELREVLEPLVPEVLVLEGLELVGLGVLLELLGVLLELELLGVLELLDQEMLLELQLEVLLELELLESQLQLLPASPLPAHSPYTEQPRGLTERHEPASRPTLPNRVVRTGRRVPRPLPLPVPGTYQMALRPSSIPLRVPLPSPPASSLADGPDPKSDSLRAASRIVTRLLATVVTDPSFESTAASALVAELVDFAARCCLDYASILIAESESVSPLSVGGECALATDVHEDKQDDFECFAVAVRHLVSMLIAPEGDPDAPDTPTLRSYAEAIEGPYYSQWQSTMDAEMASWKSTGTYVDEVPPPWANIVSGMWIFMVKRPPGSLPVFKVRYVARGFSH
ncbi:unnamed protein product [Closterium sp. NIES-64]|nr:unnamed protein product [Closterium sp. NIES-64]